MKKGMMGLALLAAGLAQGAALDGGTVYAWRGEKAVVWFDATNRTPAAALWRPSSACAFVRAGLAMPVKGDGDRLYADRVVWGGAALVQPGEAVRVVAEAAVPRTGDVPAVFTVSCGDAARAYALDVCARPFPEGRDRRVFLDLWQHPWAVARYYRVEPFSKQHEAKMRPLWEQLADAGQKVITATIMDRPWAHQCFDAYRSMVRHIRTADGGWRFDYTVFDRYVAFARACGLGPQIHCYTLCPFRLKRYYWEDEKGTACFGDFEVGSPEFVDYWRAFLEDFAAHLKAKGLFETTYIALDERSPAELKAACDLVKRHGGMKIAMAGDRPPSQFDGIEIDNFSIALQFVTPTYLAEAHDDGLRGGRQSLHGHGPAAHRLHVARRVSGRGRPRRLPPLGVLLVAGEPQQRHDLLAVVRALGRRRHLPRLPGRAVAALPRAAQRPQPLREDPAPPRRGPPRRGACGDVEGIRLQGPEGLSAAARDRGPAAPHGRARPCGREAAVTGVSRSHPRAEMVCCAR